MKRMSMTRVFQSEHKPAASAFNAAASIMRADVRRASALCFVSVPLLPLVYLTGITVRLWRSIFSPLRACPVH